MSENYQKSKEEIALELFIYLSSGQIKSGIEYKPTKNAELLKGDNGESRLGLENRRAVYLNLFKDCLTVVKDDDKPST